MPEHIYDSAPDTPNAHTLPKQHEEPRGEPQDAPAYAIEAAAADRLVAQLDNSDEPGDARRAAMHTAAIVASNLAIAYSIQDLVTAVRESRPPEVSF